MQSSLKRRSVENEIFEGNGKQLVSLTGKHWASRLNSDQIYPLNSKTITNALSYVRPIFFCVSFQEMTPSFKSFRILHNEFTDMLPSLKRFLV